MLKCCIWIRIRAETNNGPETPKLAEYVGKYLKIKHMANPPMFPVAEKTFEDSGTALLVGMDFFI